MIKEKVLAITSIIAVIRDRQGKKKTIKTKNLITNAGDLHMAEKLAGDTPTVAFANCVLGTGSTAAAKDDDYSDMTPIAGSEKAPSAGYPKTNDDDGDNTGAAADICTWCYEWTTGDFNDGAVREGCITKATPSGSDALFNRWVWGAAFEKASDATMKLFVNVEITGA